MPKDAKSKVEVMMPRPKGNQEEERLKALAAKMGKDPKVVAAIREAREEIKAGKTITHEEVMSGHAAEARGERKRQDAS
jgi:hypothetical protein